MLSSSSKHTFSTLTRESAFRNPPSGSSTFPILNEFIAPHIESFNALFDDSGLPSGDGDGSGLLSLAIKDIGERVAFDGAGQAAAGDIQKACGNRLSSKNSNSLHSFSSPLRNSKSGSSKSPLRDLWSPTEIEGLWSARYSQPRWVS
jgi:hypothetical protein